MGGKLTAIFLFIVGAGLILYFVNSGGATKIASVLGTPPSTATSTIASTTLTAPASTSQTTAPAATSSSNPFITFLDELFHPGAIVGPTIPRSSGSGGSSGSSGQSQTQTTSPSTSSIPASEIPAGLTLAQLSPYFHWVTFDEVGTGEIIIQAPGKNNVSTTIDITGWEVKTNRGGEYIPQAVNIYDPSSAPFLSDIVLTTSQSDSVNLYSNSSPVNLRLNECMGFLNGSNGQFNPGLPSSCPSVSSTQISSFTGQCQNYIYSLGCSAPDMSSTQIPRSDYQCQQYLEHNFTYQSCIMNHATDAQFLSNTWYVWMGGNPIDQYHDNVELLDKNSLVVDTYTY